MVLVFLISKLNIPKNFAAEILFTACGLWEMMQAEHHSSDVKMVSFFLHPEGIEKVDSIGFKIAHEYISGLGVSTG